MPKKEGLNVIPLIDIMLVLLAIVLSISTFIAQGNIKIDLPNSESAEKKQDENDKIAVLAANYRAKGDFALRIVDQNGSHEQIVALKKGEYKKETDCANQSLLVC